ncbi:TrkH family potassium uptake protein [Roseisalinus antarcticus]|uniref:Trk system potassium uptake protein TrkG n=1 Tax=Roseisalinus antarcticus TaxID=254357 RepID=A0A1Y5RAW4_9RHOB|nr:potassium transporter TrkG [Roseisalinus antarcticus]SLN13060.1 Trk system potassium uptake protein TrkG [Roseisalinus antarcticus]
MRGPLKDRRKPRQPLFVVLMWFGAGAMFIPGLHAYAREEYPIGQAFVNGALLFILTSVMVALALRGRLPDESAFAQLAALLAAFTVLPLGFALPFWAALGDGTLFGAWFEMVSAFSTTGATLWVDATALDPSLHLWRAIVGWMGGLLIWVAAVAVFAPLNLGGFEVRANIGRGDLSTQFSQVTRTAGPYERLDRYFMQLAPIYGGLTLGLAILLIMSGQDPFHAICHALSVMSTSGITPGDGPVGAGGGIWAEVVILAFLVLALSRRTYGRSLPGESGAALIRDPEFQLAMAIIGAGSAMLFARHWLGSGGDGDFIRAAQALWGGLFTIASFLTTLGFESQYWEGATAWSGLQAPGLVLLGLAIFGGGIGTTAGGVKLLRVYALYKHGNRELQRLILPSSVGGAGAEARRIRRGGAMIAWVFFMLFAMSLAAIILFLTATGVNFEDAVVLAIAALANCGPLAMIAPEAPISYAALPQVAQVGLAVAMIVGRLELLAVIALLNPDFWRS